MKKNRLFDRQKWLFSAYRISKGLHSWWSKCVSSWYADTIPRVKSLPCGTLHVFIASKLKKIGFFDRENHKNPAFAAQDFDNCLEPGLEEGWDYRDLVAKE